MFESGEVKFVVLRMLKEKPMHGYEVMRALEERMAGCYTPSAGTVYPTLQLLEDGGYVKAVESNGVVRGLSGGHLINQLLQSVFVLRVPLGKCGGRGNEHDE